MSKMDDLRAMREARYAQRVIRPVAAPAPVAPDLGARFDAIEPGDAPELCGHRAISGRSCTREHGHAAKSHRYG